jgi:tetratricopeptide (TPR) repeat protein
MKKDTRLQSVLLIACLLFSINSYCQTKKEKTVVAKGKDAAMYNSTESKEANAFFDEGSKKQTAEDYKGAIKSYKKALKADPKFVEVYDNIGVCYRRIGDFKNAIENYEKSIELYPQGAMAHQNLGLIFAIQKEYDKAIAQYKEVQKYEPENPEGYYGTITIYIALKDYKSAIKNAAKTLEIYEATSDPYLPDAQYLLGLSYYYDNDFKNSKIYIEQAKKAGAQIPQKMLTDLGIK